MSKTFRGIPTELRCYGGKPESNCDKQLALNLRDSIEWIASCCLCNKRTYTLPEKRKGICFECRAKRLISV